MNVKMIVSDWLRTHGYDGLCNVDVPCGCLVGDLAPCGEVMNEECRAGHRQDVAADCDCECDGRGTKHWHVCVSLCSGIEEHFQDYANWVCECGQRCNPSSAEWRWNGREWEHFHGYPIGHVAAVRTAQAQKEDAT
jgi:hypothetical protein